MLDNTVAMRAVMERERLDPGRLLFDDLEETELERCRGAWRPAMSSIVGAAKHWPDVETAASMFEKRVSPLRRVAKTQKQYCRAWRCALCRAQQPHAALLHTGSFQTVMFRSHGLGCLGHPSSPTPPSSQMALPGSEDAQHG